MISITSDRVRRCFGDYQIVSNYLLDVLVAPGLGHYGVTDSKNLPCIMADCWCKCDFSTVIGYPTPHLQVSVPVPVTVLVLAVSWLATFYVLHSFAAHFEWLFHCIEGDLRLIDLSQYVSRIP